MNNTTLTKTFAVLASSSVAAVSLFTGNAQAAVLQAQTIDPLDQAQGATIFLGGGSVSPGPVTVSGGLLNGATRNITLNTVGTGGSLRITRVEGSGLSLSLDDATTGNGLISYTGANANFLTGGTGVSNPDRITLQALSSNQSGNLALTVNGVTVTKGYNGLIGNANPVQELDFFFSEFAGVDFSAVTALSVLITPNNTAGNVSIGFFATRGEMDPIATPEPATLLGLLAVAGLGGASLKRKLK